MLGLLWCASCGADLIRPVRVERVGEQQWVVQNSSVTVPSRLVLRRTVLDAVMTVCPPPWRVEVTDGTAITRVVADTSGASTARGDDAATWSGPPRTEDPHPVLEERGAEPGAADAPVRGCPACGEDVPATVFCMRCGTQLGELNLTKIFTASNRAAGYAEADHVSLARILPLPATPAPVDDVPELRAVPADPTAADAEVSTGPERRRARWRPLSRLRHRRRGDAGSPSADAVAVSTATILIPVSHSEGAPTC